MTNHTIEGQKLVHMKKELLKEIFAPKFAFETFPPLKISDNGQERPKSVRSINHANGYANGSELLNLSIVNIGS